MLRVIQIFIRSILIFYLTLILFILKGRESREFMIQLLERLEQRLNDREQETDIEEEEEEDFISCKEHDDLNQLEDRLKDRQDLQLRQRLVSAFFVFVLCNFSSKCHFFL